MKVCFSEWDVFDTSWDGGKADLDLVEADGIGESAIFARIQIR
jgi:hypothetical protein